MFTYANSYSLIYDGEMKEKNAIDHNENIFF